MDNNGSSDDKKLLRSKIRTKENGKQTLALAEREIQRIVTNLDISDSVSQIAKAIYRRSLD